MRMDAAVLKDRQEAGRAGPVVSERHWMGAGLYVSGPSQPDRESLADPVRPCEYRISIAGLLRR